MWHKAKPASAKGVYIKKITVSSTMGPGLIIDQASLSAKILEQLLLPNRLWGLRYFTLRLSETVGSLGNNKLNRVKTMTAFLRRR